MNSRQKMFLVFGLLFAGTGIAQREAAGQSGQPLLLNPATTQQDSPARQRIAAARQQLKADPKKVQAYNELALAFIRRARETADLAYLNEAADALNQGIKLDSTDFSLQRTQVALMLSRHEFTQARDLAKALNHRTPDDVMTYGYIAEADIALGNYPEAETNAQWMMNLRPNNTPALMVGATLRVLFGDSRGAIEFLNRAGAQTSPVEVEEQAWIANQDASILIDSGQIEQAAQVLKQAAQSYPNYPYTTENLARVRMAQNRPAEAVQLLLTATALDHDPHALYQLATAQQSGGQVREARATIDEFKKLANDPAHASDESKRDLILMLAESRDTAPDALKLAQAQIKTQHDVWTLDAYAWALFVNGEFQEANANIQKAMAVGIQSAQIFDHAGHIAQKLNRGEDATKYFKLAVQSDPTSKFADDAFKSASLGPSLGKGPIDAHPNSGLNAPGNEPLVSADAQASRRATDRANKDEVHAHPGTTNIAFQFARVPESLLIPAPTDTGRLIQKAQTTLARNAKDAEGYAVLGAAYFQRARETGDVSDYQMAEEALAKSLGLDSSDFSAADALGSMAEVCMGEHRFQEALSYAQKALSLGTGDVSPFAIVGDAYADMGEYDKAAAAYARLTPRDMTLSPHAAYARDSRLAYIKFVEGDTAGAIELMKASVAEGVEAQLPRENLAWLYYELGEFDTQAGDYASADSAYLAALNTHPGDYRALAALGKLRANNGRYEEAIVLYQKAIAVVPMPIFIAELGDLYAHTGNQAEAPKQYALVEYIGLLGKINQVLHNRDLALFYADHDTKLPEALDLAQKELDVRHDIYSWDALAWALFKNGKLAEAATASEKAMRLGTKDPILLYHAGMIAESLGQRGKALSELKEALAINPHFHLVYAEAASEKIAAMEPQLAVRRGSNDINR
jgi:tetratricopeptide (TPR) repeat protein